MSRILYKKYAEYLPSVISGVLLALSFPVFDLFLLAWIAFVPLLLSLWKKNLRQAFISGFIFGMTFFFITLYWIYHSINHFGGVPFLSSIILVLFLCCYLSIYPALFSLLFISIFRKSKLPALFVAPVIWVTLEFLRSYALSGFPWASAGYSQYKFLYIIQISDITGIYGISFLILAVNGAVSDFFFLKKRVKEMPLFPVSSIKLSLAALLVILLFSVIYGAWRLVQERPGKYITAGLVQGNIEQDKKWEPSFQKEVTDTYFTLSTELSKNSPDLIIWPETSVPFFFGRDSADTAALLDFQKNLGSSLLFGSVLVKENSSSKNFLSNSAILLDKEGKTAYTYDKIHMVPFGEYVPLKSILFFIDKLVVGIGDYSPGEKYSKAETEYGSFGTMICYEIIFPGMVRKFYTKGGDFIVTITNDAWFGKTPGPYQHFSMAVFRAIENRKPVMRSANTGVSGFIDSDGKIISQSSLFKQQTLINRIKTDSTMTFYTKFGDLFSYLCIVLFVILLVNISWRR
jgi:apolipoprotein N-acyltransferase